MLLVWLIQTTVQLLVTAQINLTPFGTATQSSLYEGKLGDPQNAILPPITNYFTLDTCSHTAIGSDPSADWWMFQFSFGFAYITDIIIYYRERTGIRMDGFKLYVTNTSTIPPDGFLCYEDPDPGLPNLTQIIPCSEVGKYVIYYDNKGAGNEGPVIELCYIAINGCPKGMWGTNCSETCSSICIDQHCHPENGTCIWGCHPQTYLNETCDTRSGACTEGCVIGWQYCTCSECKIKVREENYCFTQNKSNGTSDTMLPSNIILDLLKNVNDCWEENKGPITVVCSDGCSKSGIFVALRLILEKLAIDDEIDVFQVVRTIQVRRPEFLMNFVSFQ
ncbi:unnamed protein product [Mytilus edulis]|uniref:Uncharacterized protein n=1 Tax=Mytilus edulis TaxID=6550 RepID=A0A8S3QYE8_MYTED|nr:unnamed protein product [Mytilus edulis]